MKAKILIPVAGIVVVAALIWGYRQMSGEQAADKEADQPIAPASHVRRAPNGETVVTIALKTQQLIGLETAPLVTADLSPEIKAYGLVLDSAALVSLENNVVSAQAALQASQAEYERLAKLSAQNNTSAFALQSSEARTKQDQVALDTARAQLLAASGKALLREPADFFQQLVGQESVLVRLDLPAGEATAEEPAVAQVRVPGTARIVPAKFLGRAATADPRDQGEGFLLLVTNAPAELVSGLAVVGFLQSPGEPFRGVIVPDGAVVRTNERDWLYIQTDPTNFARREITLNHPVSSGWFVTNNVAPGDKAVVIGAQTLLSEEGKSQFKLED